MLRGDALQAPNSRAGGRKNKRINIRVQKKWMLRTGLPDHPLVCMRLYPQTALQAGFALTEKAAREMAAGLTTQANSLTKGEANKPKAIDPRKFAGQSAGRR